MKYIFRKHIKAADINVIGLISGLAVVSCMSYSHKSFSLVFIMMICLVLIGCQTSGGIPNKLVFFAKEKADQHARLDAIHARCPQKETRSMKTINAARTICNMADNYGVYKDCGEQMYMKEYYVRHNYWKAFYKKKKKKSICAEGKQIIKLEDYKSLLSKNT